MKKKPSKPVFASPQGRRKLVHVEWADASGSTSTTWKDVWGHDFEGTYRCWTVGWLVAESRTHVHIVSSFGNIDEADNEQFSSTFAIPKGMILRMLRLKQLPARKR